MRLRASLYSLVIFSLSAGSLFAQQGQLSNAEQIQLQQLQALTSAAGNALRPPSTKDDKKAAKPLTPAQQAEAKLPRTKNGRIDLDAIRRAQQQKRIETVFPNAGNAGTVAVNNGPQVVLPSVDPAKVIDEQAFRKTLRSALPLSPDNIHRLRKHYEADERAISRQTSGTPPKPTATSKIVNLAPGSTPPVIRLAQGFVTSLVFLDSSGADWPIVAYDLGNPDAFNIQWDRSSNTLMVQASKLYTYGNLAIRLKDLSTPVMLTLIPGQSAVDYRVDLRIQGYGPNASRIPSGSGLPADANKLLLSILDGVAPVGSRQLRVPSSLAEAWVFGNKMYVRTRLTLISPGWLATMSSADGMHAYEMQATPLLLVSHQGKLIRMKLQGL